MKVEKVKKVKQAEKAGGKMIGYATETRMLIAE